MVIEIPKRRKVGGFGELASKSCAKKEPKSWDRSQPQTKIPSKLLFDYPKRIPKIHLPTLRNTYVVSFKAKRGNI